MLGAHDARRRLLDEGRSELWVAGLADARGYASVSVAVRSEDPRNGLDGSEAATRMPVSHVLRHRRGVRRAPPALRHRRAHRDRRPRRRTGEVFPTPGPPGRLRRAVLRVPIITRRRRRLRVHASRAAAEAARCAAGPIVQERMSQSIGGLDARGRRVLEHAPHELDEEAVVFWSVPGLAAPSSSRTARVGADDVRQAPRLAHGLVSLPGLGLQRPPMRRFLRGAPRPRRDALLTGRGIGHEVLVPC